MQHNAMQADHFNVKMPQKECSDTQDELSCC